MLKGAKMREKRIKLFSMLCLILFGCLVSSCIQNLSKVINTDQSGAAESSVSIIHPAKIAFTGYSSVKLECNSLLSIQIIIVNRDVVKDKFIFVDKGAMAEDLQPISVRSGDQAKIKISNGCTDTKYTINYTLSVED
jgi:hypothetical protein